MRPIRPDDARRAQLLKKNAAPKSRLHTDESNLYPKAGVEFAKHETVKHSAKDYVSGDVHTNSAEDFFGVFKRGMRGIYQHCSDSTYSATSTSSPSATTNG